MIMVLCLMFYSIAEWRLRTKLEQENETVPDQKGKPTKDLQWPGYFSNSRELQNFLLKRRKSGVGNTEYGGVHWKILSLMGEEYENIYL